MRRQPRPFVLLVPSLAPLSAHYTQRGKNDSFRQPVELLAIVWNETSRTGLLIDIGD